jgi:hypothetical protein
VSDLEEEELEHRNGFRSFLPGHKTQGFKEFATIGD